jgi:hypothetical protein
MLRIQPIVLLGVVALAVGSLVVVGAALFFVGNAWFGLPVGAQGPEQPVAFPHTVHAGSIEDGGLGLECTFCHRNAPNGAAAMVPSVEQCMFCHKKISGTTAQAIVEIGKFRGIGDDGNPLDNPIDPLQPIDWVRVHRLPDHVQFVHDIHVRYLMSNPDLIVNSKNLNILDDGTVNASQTCSTCHGAVETMTKVKQIRALKMGDCVDCHRENSAPTDCAICHY